MSAVGAGGAESRQPSPGGEIVVYQREDGSPAVEVRFDGDSVWVTQAQLVDLLQSSKANISEHIANIFAEGELTPDSTVRDLRTVRQEGSRTVERSLTYYNLDVILSVGYRVRSKIATQFRIWATDRLREDLVKGFTTDDELTGLNRPVSAHADAAELRTQVDEPIFMKDWLVHLDRPSTAMGADLPAGAVVVSRRQPAAKAESDRARSRTQLSTAFSDVERANLELIEPFAASGRGYE